MPTVAYLRCSTDEQDTLRQREAIQRSGLKIDQWLEDHESRDKAHKRPDFQRLLRGVQAGQVKTVVVQALDRFGVRDAWELGKFFSILKDHDCRLLDAAGKQLNADDDGSVICSTVGALTSSREQREKASRVLTGKLTLARKGTFLGGYCPYGCDVVAFNAEGKEVWRVVYEGHAMQSGERRFAGGRFAHKRRREPFCKGSLLLQPGLIKPIKGLTHAFTLAKAAGALYPVWKLLFPRYVCTLEDVGRAMIRAAADGYSKNIIECTDIAILAGSGYNSEKESA